MNLGVLEVLAGFIYCLQENGPKKASSCFEEFMVLNAPTPNSVRAESNNSYSDEKKNTAHRDDDDDDDNNNNNYNNNNNNNNNSNNNIKFLYLPSSVSIALILVAPCKCLKQIIQIKLNRVKNPNWPKANQRAI